MSVEEQTQEGGEKHLGEIEPMQEDNKPRIKNITERQAENLKAARQRKLEIKLAKDQLDSTMNQNLKYIYNRLENIDAKIASSVGKRTYSDDDMNDQRAPKKKKEDKKEITIAPTLSEQLFQKGLQIVTLSVAVFTFGFAKNLITNGWARYREGHNSNNTMDGDPASFGLPMV
jgi:preprotein translocase subunit SecF